MKRYTMAFFMGIILIVNLVASPSMTLKEEPRVVNTEFSNYLANVQRPLAHKERAYLTSVFLGNEMLNDIEVHFIVNRSIQNFSNSILRINYILSPSIGFCVMIYCFGYVIKKRRRYKSILSRFLGGHAPPMTAFAD